MELKSRKWHGACQCSCRMRFEVHREKSSVAGLSVTLVVSVVVAEVAVPKQGSSCSHLVKVFDNKGTQSISLYQM